MEKRERSMPAFLLAAALMLASPSLPAKEIHVPEDARAIGLAVEAAKDGDVVIVADGTYKGSSNRDISFGGKKITVRSANGPEHCVIDCEKLGRAFLFRSAETRDSVLCGFTLRSGKVGTGLYGE